MNKFIQICLLWVIISLTPCCTSKSQDSVSYLDKNTYEKLMNLCPDKNISDLIVYYFDGDCSICLGKAREVDSLCRQIQSTRVVFIAKAINPAIFIPRWNGLKIRSCVYIERNNEFEKSLKLLKVTKINTDRSEEDYDSKIPR
jgi:hypothetical protein